MSQIDNHSPSAEIIEELNVIAPTLAQYKEELSQSAEPWSAKLTQKDWNSVHSTKKTITMRFLRYAAVLAPFITVGYFAIRQDMPSDNPIADVSELEQDIVLELLADQAYNIRTEDLLDVTISTNLFIQE